MVIMKKQEAAKAVLKEKGYKLTPQRRATLETFTENQGRHLSPEDVFMLVRKKCPEIGIATIYRTLQLLEQLGVINKLSFNDGCSRYELSGSEEDHHHHHLICITCGDVQEVEEDLLEHLEKKIKEKNNFEVINHRVKFFGYCSKCSNK